MEIKSRLEIDFAGIKLKNPILVSSGTFGCGREYAELIDLNRLGGIITKSITEKPHKGNPPPRLAEVSGGLLNAIGLENEGIDNFLREKLPFLRQFKTSIIVNIAGFTEDEYVRLTARLNQAEGIAALEVNLSCPNVKKGGINFGSEPEILKRLVKRIRASTKLPLLIKLSPNVGDIVKFAGIAAEAGADGLSLINTVLGLSIDVNSFKPKLANVTGGLSGPAIRPIALRMIWDVYKRIKLPILGSGGIMRTEDALEFFIAGARAVAIGTANFVNPRASLEIIQGIKKYLDKHEFKSIKEIIGKLKVNSR
ncbi:MAG: dihydroorotate dehydrogenase [Candidatus Ratteibacteria bacterium]|nr:dihydroorotate dehydrogenase [Candidatus Ratteibacteria bacterium]